MPCRSQTRARNSNDNNCDNHPYDPMFELVKKMSADESNTHNDKSSQDYEDNINKISDYFESLQHELERRLVANAGELDEMT